MVMLGLVLRLCGQQQPTYKAFHVLCKCLKCMPQLISTENHIILIINQLTTEQISSHSQCMDNDNEHRSASHLQIGIRSELCGISAFASVPGRHLETVPTAGDPIETRTRQRQRFQCGGKCCFWLANNRNRSHNCNAVVVFFIVLCAGDSHENPGGIPLHNGPRNVQEQREKVSVCVAINPLCEIYECIDLTI